MEEEPRAEPTRTGPSLSLLRGDGAAACAVGLLLAGAVALLFQERFYVDGPMFVYALSRDLRTDAYFLYLPTAKALRALARPMGLDLDPEGALEAVNLLAAFLLGVSLYLAARGVGGSRLRSVGVVLLTASTPPVLMYLTAIESHALHAAAAGLAFACAARMGPHRIGLRTLGLSLAMLAIVGTHLSGPLLLPGVLAWALLRARERGVRLRPLHLLLFALPWIAAGLPFLARLTEGLSHAPRIETFLPWHVRALLSRLSDWTPAQVLPTVESAIAVPTALAFAGGASGLFRALLTSRSAFFVALLFLLPYVAVLSLWRSPEEGEYAIPLVPLFSFLTLDYLGSAARHLPGGSAARGGLAALPFLGAAAWHLGLFPGAGALAVASSAALGLWTGLRERRGLAGPETSSRLASALLGLVVAGQAVLGILPIVERNRENPEAEWVADAAKALPPASFVLTRGWPEVFLLRLEAGMASEVIETAAQVAPAVVVLAVDAGVRSGGVFVVEDRAIESSPGDPRVAALVGALRRAFEWEAVAHGRFRGHRLLPREAGTLPAAEAGPPRER